MSRPAAALALAAALLAACAATEDGGQRAKAPARAPPMAPPAPAMALTPSPTELRNAGFEAGLKPAARCAIGWDCTMHNNPESFRFTLLDHGAAGGRHSLCVERIVDEPWALVTQAFQTPALRGKRLRLSMAVGVEGASGEGAGPWVLAEGRPPVSARKLARGTAGWQRLAVEFSVPADASVVVVGATLEGPGKACFDDVRLEVL